MTDSFPIPPIPDPDHSSSPKPTEAKLRNFLKNLVTEPLESSDSSESTPQSQPIATPTPLQVELSLPRTLPEHFFLRANPIPSIDPDTETSRLAKSVATILNTDSSGDSESDSTSRRPVESLNEILTPTFLPHVTFDANAPIARETWDRDAENRGSSEHSDIEKNGESNHSNIPNTGADGEDTGKTAEVQRRSSWRGWRRWFFRSGYWYTTSFLIHLIALTIFATIALFLPDVVRHVWNPVGNSPSFNPVDSLRDPIEFEIYDTGRRPTLGGDLELDVSGGGGGEELDESEFTGGLYDPDAIGEEDLEEWEKGGAGPAIAWDGASIPGGGFESVGLGPGQPGGGVGLQFGDGSGNASGTGGKGYGLRRRGGPGGNGGPGGVGGTSAAQRSVEAALWWLYRHQANDGHWSLDHTNQCKDGGCDGGSRLRDDVGATALAILPFLGAGQTHKDRGRYQQVVSRGLHWLLKQQESDGRIVGSSPKKMYSHAIATTAICEAYGMTNDPELREPAERAIQFIEWAQHPETGGWRYDPHDEGDLSVTAWQIMALQSGKMAGLFGNTEIFERSRTFLDIVAEGAERGLFQYQLYTEVTPGRTAMGLLCLQYLGERPDTRRYQEGKQYILNSFQDPNFFDPGVEYMSQRDVYSWYYITLVLHNTLDRDWDRWNRTMRKELIRTQCRSDGCDFGSWSPTKPSKDAWGSQGGGRLMTTVMATLNLEIYYRYLPLFQTTSE